MLGYVISLDRTPERLKRFREVNVGAEWIQHFAAVDGQSLEPRRLQQQGLIELPLQYTAGALGCALSHRSLWERAVEAHEPVSIFEDDAELHGQASQLMSSLLAQLPEDWDVVLWGWNFDTFVIADIPGGLSPVLLNFQQDTLRQKRQVYLQQAIAPTLLRATFACGIPGYSVSVKGARALLNQCFPLRDFELKLNKPRFSLPNYGIDVVMNTFYGQNQCYLCLPPLVVSPNEHDKSTVQIGQRGAG